MEKLEQITFRVKSRNKNFLLSPVSMAWHCWWQVPPSLLSLWKQEEHSPLQLWWSAVNGDKGGTLTLQVFLTYNKDNGVISSLQDNMHSSVVNVQNMTWWPEIAFILSVMYKKSSSSIFTRSPEWGHPSLSKASLVLSPILRKPMKMLCLQKQITPSPRVIGEISYSICKNKIFSVIYIH